MISPFNRSNKYLENPRDGARTIENGLVLVSIISLKTAVKVSVISTTWFQFYCRLKQKIFVYLKKWKKVSFEQ